MVVPKGPFDIIPAYVQVMPGQRPGDKPLSEPIRILKDIQREPLFHDLTLNNG